MWSSKSGLEDHKLIGNAHIPDGIDYQNTLNKTFDSQTVYDGVDTVSVYSFGSCSETYTVPEGSVYAGFSAWEGHIFRSGTDVYALRLDMYNHDSEIGEMVVLAHGVKEVIMANYRYNDDAWSQPLLLMEDGTVKVYQTWDDGPTDDPSNLKDPVYEGGWDRSRYH